MFFKKNIKRYIFGLIFCCIIISSCNNAKEECIGYETGYVVSTNTPKTGKINESILIDVVFNINSGCGSFNKFIENESKNIKTIEIEAKLTGCICPQYIPEISTTYEFNESEKGVYYLQFKSSVTEFMIDTITVN